MQFGTVKSWDDAKGFGFIVSDDDEDLFVHSSGLRPGVPGGRLREGQRVGFDVRRDFKGDKAVNVRPVDR